MPNAATLPPAISLPDELARALEADSPLLVMVSLEGCPFCKIVRESYLAPLRQEQGLPVLQVDMRSQRSVRNFNGSTTTHEALITAWRIELATTVLFLVRQGIEIALRLVMVLSPSYEQVRSSRRLMFVKFGGEDVADNLFNPDPYYQQGGDMVRVGGLQYTCTPNAGAGKRIDNMRLGGKPVEADRTYKVAGWAPVSEAAKTAGSKPIWDLVEPWLKAKGSVAPRQLNMPKLVGIDSPTNNPRSGSKAGAS